MVGPGTTYAPISLVKMQNYWKELLADNFVHIICLAQYGK